MRVLCFGGSFNPIHHGHLICARAAAEAGGFDRVVLIPTAQPPHKPNSSDLAPASDRLEMCRLAALGGDLFVVDDIETKTFGPNFTFDTAAQLKLRGWREVHWLIGGDMLMYLPKWHRVAELIHQVSLVVMARPGTALDWGSLPPDLRFLADHVVPTPLIDISASEIRRRVAAGLSIDYLCPPAVCEYIHRRGLYRCRL